MKNLTWQNPEQLFVAQELINKVKSKCCGIKVTEDFSFKAGKTEHHFQLSLDFMNIGNMINSKWGVMKNASSSNGCRILKYEGMDDNKTPIFSMYKINGEYPTETYSYNRIYTECWKMQVGIRYIFN